MKKEKIRAYCRRCRHQQMFVRSQMHHGIHLLFSVLTLGLWAVSWLSIYLGHFFRPWRCEHCRWHKPEFSKNASVGPLSKSGRLSMTRTELS